MSPSQIVMADAQFGTARILRPPTGFEDLYEGLPISSQSGFPLYLFQQGRALDPLAGRPGYDPQLAAAIRVPFGARVVLWLPNLFYQDGDAPLVLRSYEYIIGWRLRNVFDFRISRIPWHLARGRGPNDTTAGASSQARVVIPAAYNTVVYNQPEPASVTLPDTLRAIQRGRAEDIQFGAVQLFGPVLSAGLAEGYFQQGVEDPATAGANARRPGFLVHEVQAVGDELFIGIKRSGDVVPTWSFAAGVWPVGADAQLSRLLGSGTGTEFPDVGVYVFTGSAP